MYQEVNIRFTCWELDIQFMYRESPRIFDSRIGNHQEYPRIEYLIHASEIIENIRELDIRFIYQESNIQFTDRELVTPTMCPITIQ